MKEKTQTDPKKNYQYRGQRWQIYVNRQLLKEFEENFSNDQTGHYKYFYTQDKANRDNIVIYLRAEKTKTFPNIIPNNAMIEDGKNDNFRTLEFLHEKMRASRLFVSDIICQNQETFLYQNTANIDELSQVFITKEELNNKLHQHALLYQEFVMKTVNEALQKDHLRKRTLDEICDLTQEENQNEILCKKLFVEENITIPLEHKSDSPSSHGIINKIKHFLVNRVLEKIYTAFNF